MNEITEKDFKDLFKGKKIEKGESDKVDAFPAYVEKILEALEKVSGIGGAFVTDRSMFSDFMLDEPEEIEIYGLLGVTRVEDEYFGDLAVRLFQKDNPAN